MDSFAVDVGCLAAPEDAPADDVRLRALLTDGLVAPATYRLQGPHAWPGARQYLAKL